MANKLVVARIRNSNVYQDQRGLVLCAKQALDNDMNATGQMLAALTRWTRAAFGLQL